MTTKKIGGKKRVGLARALSKLGYASRAQAADVVRGGAVRVNGQVRRDPESPVNWERDRIEVAGAKITAAAFRYLMLNKPRGAVTTRADEQSRATVYSLLDPSMPWLAPVGRLDKASEGLLLLTNDTARAARITDPASHLLKTYHVQINVADPAEVIARMQRGVRDDGELLRLVAVRELRRGARNCWLEVTLDEGRNRQIRRMVAACGAEVLRLVRVAIGDLQLGDLAKGKWRELTAEERRGLSS